MLVPLASKSLFGGDRRLVTGEDNALPKNPFTGSRRIRTERAVQVALRRRSPSCQEAIVPAFGYSGMFSTFLSLRDGEHAKSWGVRRPLTEPDHRWWVGIRDKAVTRKCMKYGGAGGRPGRMKGQRHHRDNGIKSPVLCSRSWRTRADSMGKISGLRWMDSRRVPKPRQLPKPVLRPRGLA
jgi:hypothetical protein